MNMIYHADDFGITLEQSRRILQCSDNCGGAGVLNSISILATSPHFEECAALLEPLPAHLLVSLHINIVEGPCCSNPADIPLLADSSGCFHSSFAQMLALSYGSQARELRRQLDIEIGAQLDAFLTRFPHMKNALRVDSHQHFHLIPAVFDALLDAIRSRGCTLSFMRIPAEPLLPFLRTPSIWLRIPPINWLKHWLLNRLWKRNQAKLPEFNQVSAVFCGIFFSGHMTIANVEAVLPRLQDYANKKHMPLELLFHPGGYEDPSSALDPKLKGFVQFYQSPLRAQEAHALTTLKQADPSMLNRISRKEGRR